jgi:hypothetical protein
VALTVKNYLTWCSLTANGQPVTGTAPGSTTSQTICVAAGTVNLVAKPLNGSFEIGPAPWHGTAGDTGSGDPGTQVDAGVNSTSTTTVAVSSGSKCVWACCPFANGTGCSTVANQCP